VASPGFVARRGKARNYVMGNSRQTSGVQQHCSMTNSFVTNAVLIECDLLTFATADLADYSVAGDATVSDVFSTSCANSTDKHENPASVLLEYEWWKIYHNAGRQDSICIKWLLKTLTLELEHLYIFWDLLEVRGQKSAPARVWRAHAPRFMNPHFLYANILPRLGKSSESAQCAITGPCLRMRHRPSA